MGLNSAVLSERCVNPEDISTNTNTKTFFKSVHSDFLVRQKYNIFLSDELILVKQHFQEKIQLF